MKSTELGQSAEKAVADYLKKRGYRMLDINWRRPRCEIDLVAQKDKVIYFVEVKYRSSQAQGGGFEYITPQKQHQMQFAASLWVNENDWNGDWRLLAASASGPKNELIETLELN